jgi:hypothetical protein
VVRVSSEPAKKRVTTVVEEEPKRSGARLEEALEQASQEAAGAQGAVSTVKPEPLIGGPLIVHVNVLNNVSVNAPNVDASVSVKGINFTLRLVNLRLLGYVQSRSLEVDEEPGVGVKPINEPIIAELPALKPAKVTMLNVDSTQLINTVTFNPPIVVGALASSARVNALLTLGTRVNAVDVDESHPVDVISRVLEAIGVRQTYPAPSMLDLGLMFEDKHGNIVGASSVFNCEGTTVVTYSDEYGDKGLDESLALIAVELERIVCGKSFDPRFIDLSDEDEVRDLEVLIRDEGVYVIRGDVKDDKQRNKVGRVFNRFFGYNPKVVIMSEGLAKNFMLKPSIYVKVPEVRLNVIKVLAMAYTGFATGPYCSDILLTSSANAPALNTLAMARLCYTTRVRETVRWVLENAPDKLRPSVGGSESETHMNLKALVIRHLIETGHNFKVEDEITECKSGVPDILVDGHIAIDVKASIGSLPTNDIVEAYRRYSDCASEVWVVFKPFTVLAFTKPILKTLENLELKPKVKVPLFNQEEKFYELVDVADFLNSIYEHIKGGILHQPAT